MSHHAASRTLLGLSALALTSLVVIGLGWIFTPVRRSSSEVDVSFDQLFIG